MSKKLALLSILIPGIILAGCFSTDTSGGNTQSDQTSDTTRTYNNNEVAFQFPSKWNVIEPKDFTSEIPAETRVVIRNNIKNDTFTANVNVVKNDLQTTKSSLDYSKEILNRQRNGLLDYKETKRELIKIPISGQDQETYYMEFEARLNSTEPLTKFIQTYAVKDKSGYIIMAAYSPEENSTNIDQLQSVVKSFRVN